MKACDPAPLEMLHEGHRGRHRLAPSGLLCTANARDLEWTVALLCIDGASAIELDLQRVDIVDERGEQAIGAAMETCAEHGFGLTLTPDNRFGIVETERGRIRRARSSRHTGRHGSFTVLT